MKEKKVYEPGIYDITNKEYHESAGVSCSHFKALMQSPMHYRSWLMAERKATTEMLVGKAVHAMFLDPKSFHEEYAIAPKVDRRTTEGKEMYALFEAGLNGREVLGKDSKGEDVVSIVHGTFTALTESVANSEHLTALFTGIKEKSFFWIDKETGVLCKCRPDCLTKIGIISDLKVTYDASEAVFSATIAKMLYFMQAAWYLDGVKETIKQMRAKSEAIPEWYVEPTDFVFVPIERVSPYGIGMYQLSREDAEMGRRLLKDLLGKYSVCEKENRWEGYSSQIKKIQLPKWLYYQYGAGK